MDQKELSGESPGEEEALAGSPPAVVKPPPDSLVRDQATWRIVLALALPVLGQQLLVLSVGLSDKTGSFRSAQKSRYRGGLIGLEIEMVLQVASVEDFSGYRGNVA